MINNLTLKKTQNHNEGTEKTTAPKEGKGGNENKIFGKILDGIKNTEQKSKSALIESIYKEPTEKEFGGVEVAAANIESLIKSPNNLTKAEVGRILINGKEVQFVGEIGGSQIKDDTLRKIVNDVIGKNINLKHISVKTVFKEGTANGGSFSRTTTIEDTAQKRIKTAQLFQLHSQYAKKTTNGEEGTQAKPASKVQSGKAANETPIFETEQESERLLQENKKTKQKKTSSLLARKYIKESLEKSHVKEDSNSTDSSKIFGKEKKNGIQNNKQTEVANEDKGDIAQVEEGSQEKTALKSKEGPVLTVTAPKQEKRSAFLEKAKSLSEVPNPEESIVKEDSISLKMKDLENKQNLATKLTAEIASKIETAPTKAGKLTEIRITIEPKSLGKMDIVLNNTKDNVDISIKVSNKGVENILTESIFSLREKIEKNTSLNMNSISIYTENTRGTENNIGYRRVEEQTRQEQGSGHENNPQEHNKREDSEPSRENDKGEEINFKELQEEFLRSSL